ncbi:MAG: ABC transporter substrate-binding protein [Hydrogenophaga sp.]|nr:ABC transporter substrate-binding protein [Hydrogenophaga sp.]
MNTRRSCPAWVLGFLWCALTPVHAWADALPDPDAQVLAGRALYRGDKQFAQASRLQGVAMPGAACRQCHGPRGEARSEAGIQVPSIQWASLMQGRDARAGYRSAQGVLRAIVHGEGRQGRALQAPMPQFRLTAQEQASLLAYLKVIGTDAEPVPGVSARSVSVVSILPLSGPQADAGRRVREAMAARFDAINALGGVFGRRIDWRALDSASSAARASKVARAALQDSRSVPFALVGSLLPDPDEALRLSLKQRGVPMVATLGVAQREPAQPELTYLLPSLEAQLRDLAAEMDRRCVVKAGDEPILVLHPPHAHSIDTMREALPRSRLQVVEATGVWAPGAEPRTAATGPVIALLAQAQMAQLRAQLSERLKASSGPGCLGSLAVLSGRPPPDRSGRYAEVVALPMPPVIQDGAQPDGAALWSLLGDTAARVFAEVLARSGRALDVERFSQALDGLRHFQPVPGLSVSFGPQQRHGFDVTYLWRENAHEPLHTNP